MYNASKIMTQDAYSKVFDNKKRVMVVFAHPDDAEIYSGGLIARLVEDGKEVMVIKMTSGDKGSRQTKISAKELLTAREMEDQSSMKVLGIKDENNIYLRIPDGFVEDSIEIIDKVAEQIRVFKPELIITHNPENVIIRYDENESWMNHRDHRATGQAVLDAAYPYSRDLLFFPEHFKNKNAESHQVKEFLLVDFYGHPDTVFFDVTNTIETRTKAHAMHVSQYSAEQVQDSADFFTLSTDYPTGRRFEKFRYVKTD